MTKKPQNLSVILEDDLTRTDKSNANIKTYFWDGDTLCRPGQRKFKFSKGLENLSPKIKESIKQHLISFAQLGNYAPNTCDSFYGVLRTALNSNPPAFFDLNWTSKRLDNSSFRRSKIIISKFFTYWKEKEPNAIDQSSLWLLNDIAIEPPGPRNVLSDDPEKSWHTDEEYELLLSTVWSNYDNGISCTQVTLIKLLSLQYARRPMQIALLKIGDIFGTNDADIHLPKTHTINFPGIKDFMAESGFRASKFEEHPLSSHLWQLCQIQLHNLRALYEHTLNLSLTDSQLKKLPLFCCESRIKEALQLLENSKEDLLENLGSELFHLQNSRPAQILRWLENTPTCDYGLDKTARNTRPKPPISPRTGRPIVTSATRMRHTRARQLARLGVPKHILSHWLGHASEKSLEAYYNDPAEEARKLDEAMSPSLVPIAMAFTGALIESNDQSINGNDPTSNLEFNSSGLLKSVGRCGKHSFCATNSVPIPCYRCKHFEPLVDAPHGEVLKALVQRQIEENSLLKIGGARNILIPIDLSNDIRAVENCIARCNARKAERGV